MWMEEGIMISASHQPEGCERAFTTKSEPGGKQERFPWVFQQLPSMAEADPFTILSGYQVPR